MTLCGILVMKEKLWDVLNLVVKAGKVEEIREVIQETAKSQNPLTFLNVH
jgi:hypothetical protein